MIQVKPPPAVVIPEPPPGQALSVAPAGHRLWLDDYEYYDQLGRDPLQQASLWRIKDPEQRVAKLKEVLEQYPKQIHRRAMLHQATKRGDEPLVQCIVDTGLQIQRDFSKEPLTKEERENLETPKADEEGTILDKDDGLVAPVHEAAIRGHLGCLKIFMETHQIHVDILSRQGSTPLMDGAKHLEIVRYLLDLGANPTSTLQDMGEAPDGVLADPDVLAFAALQGNVEVIKMLLEHPLYGSTKNRKSRAGVERGVWVTPSVIMAAAQASSSDNFAQLKFLLERGSYPLEAKDGKTKAEQLSEAERRAIVDAIPWAVMDAPLESIKLLLSYVYPTDLGGNILPFEVPEDLRRPFVNGAYEAVKRNWPDKFEFIHGLGIQEHATMSLDGPPEGQKFNYQHLLDNAAEAGSIDCACLMIDKYGADPNQHRFPGGVKPLFLAAGANKIDMIRYLLEKGADIHHGSGRYATGPTALYIAIGLKSLKAVELLLQNGGPVDDIDEDIRNISGPMRAILRSDPSGPNPRVRFQTGEAADEFVAACRSNWQNLNPTFVCLELDQKDKGWIDKLQPRKPVEELRETGLYARELNKTEGTKTKYLDDKDPRRITPAFPTIGDKQEALRKDDDRIPEFKPFMVPVMNDVSD